MNCLKTHYFVWKRNWVADFIFWNQNGRYPLITHQKQFDGKGSRFSFSASVNFSIDKVADKVIVLIERKVWEGQDTNQKWN